MPRRAHVLDDPLGLLGGDLGHDPTHRLDEDEAQFRLPMRPFFLTAARAMSSISVMRLDAGETAADDREGQRALAALGRIGQHRGGFDPLEDLVAQRHGLLDGLQADAVSGEARDREGAGDGAGGHDDVEVRDLEVRPPSAGAPRPCGWRGRSR